MDANGKPHRVGEYIIANGDARQFVIYWYQAHGRSVANEYMAKIYMVVDAMRMNRTDGALVRVITPIASSEETCGRKKARRGVCHAACALAAAIYPRLSAFEAAVKGSAARPMASSCGRSRDSLKGWKKVESRCQSISIRLRWQA